jgi:hypothetical protein
VRVCQRGRRPGLLQRLTRRRPGRFQPPYCGRLAGDELGLGEVEQQVGVVPLPTLLQRAVHDAGRRRAVGPLKGVLRGFAQHLGHPLLADPLATQHVRGDLGRGASLVSQQTRRERVLASASEKGFKCLRRVLRPAQLSRSSPR